MDPARGCGTQSRYFRGLALALRDAVGGSALGALPITPFSGQILKAGHFSQPATTAIGHSVIVVSRSASRR
jgi:hypothetical protein